MPAAGASDSTREGREQVTAPEKGGVARRGWEAGGMAPPATGGGRRDVRWWLYMHCRRRRREKEDTHAKQLLVWVATKARHPVLVMAKDKLIMGRSK